MKQHNHNGRIALVFGGAALFIMIMTLAAPAASLVSRYSFSETSGTNASDTIGGYTATLSGGSSFDGAGRVVLSGTKPFVSLPTAQLSNLTVVTFESWFTYTSPSNNVHLFSIDNGSGTGSGGSYMRFNIRDNGNGHGGTNYFEGIIG
jgi:hypothetical protein